MAEYLLDKDTGIIHIASDAGCGEFTFCDRDFSSAADGSDGEIVNPGASNGPANCAECKNSIDRLRGSMKGARFSKVLKDPAHD